MTSDANYIQVLPDYEYNDVTSTSADKQRHYGDYDDAAVNSCDVLMTSNRTYSHLSGNRKQQHAAYQGLMTSRWLPGNDLQPVTSDTYDEIGDPPQLPPLRPGRSAGLSVNCSMSDFVVD